MALGFIRDLVRQYRFAPRVKDSLKLVAGPSGEAEEAIINSDAMSNNQVVLWDGTYGSTGGFKTTGITAGELAYLGGVTAGTAKASKAVVLNSNKDISGLNQVNASVFTASTRVTTPELVASSSVQTNVLQVSGNTELNGKVVQNIKVENTKKYQLYYGVSPRDMIRRESASSVYVYFGNSSDRLYLESSAYDLYHKRAGVNYKIWTAHNDGSGSGLDADLLDGQHGSYYRNAGNLNAGILPMDRLSEDVMIRYGRGSARTKTEFINRTISPTTSWYPAFGTTQIKSIVFIGSITVASGSTRYISFVWNLNRPSSGTNYIVFIDNGVSNRVQFVLPAVGNAYISSNAYTAYLSLVAFYTYY